MREIGTISRPCPQAPATSRPRASCSPRTRASPRCSRRSGRRSARRPDWPRPSPCSRPPTPPSPRSTTRPWPASSPTLTLSRTVRSPLRTKLGGDCFILQCPHTPHPCYTCSAAATRGPRDGSPHPRRVLQPHGGLGRHGEL